jgi:hypothetical protein
VSRSCEQSAPPCVRSGRHHEPPSLVVSRALGGLRTSMRLYDGRRPAFIPWRRARAARSGPDSGPRRRGSTPRAGSSRSTGRTVARRTGARSPRACASSHVAELDLVFRQNVPLADPRAARPGVKDEVQRPCRPGRRARVSSHASACSAFGATTACTAEASLSSAGQIGLGAHPAPSRELDAPVGSVIGLYLSGRVVIATTIAQATYAPVAAADVGLTRATIRRRWSSSCLVR